MERAEGGFKPLTVKSLLIAYGVTDTAEVDAFLALCRYASKPGWWHSYDDVLPAWFRVAVALEEAATLIRAYEPHVVPGATTEVTERRVALRRAGQETSSTARA
jgi:hypothetical protein